MKNKIIQYYRLIKLLISQWFIRLRHNLRGEKLSSVGTGLRDYVFNELLHADKNTKLTDYRKIIYEGMIEDCMRENNIDRDTALIQIFLLLSEYDDMEEQNDGIYRD